MITLFPDQQEWIGGLRQAFAAGYHSPLGVLPTGGGKTVCFSWLTSKLVQNSKRVVLMVHRDELVEQISKTLDRFDVRHGLITAGSLYDRRLLAHVASVMTLVKRLDRTAIPDYVIIDEAHHGAAATWKKIIAYWRSKNPNLRVIGVTATPELLSGEGLGGMFDEMVLGLTTRELIEMGRLSPYRLFAPHQAVDLSGVHMQAGDFNKKELGAALNKPSIVGSAVGEYSKLLNGAPAVAFCVSVEHAKAVAEQFQANGFRSMSIDGKMEKSLRREVVRDFGAGRINVLTSCDLISEGFDIPGMVGAILLRPTWSLAMYLQQVGRALRVCPGKESAVILDHVANSQRHGMPDDPRAWSLIGREEKRKKDSENVSCRQCDKCYAVSPASASKCRECGKPFPIKSREIEEVAGTLSEVEVARARREAARAQASAATLEDLIRLGTERGYGNPRGWASHIFNARQSKASR